MIKKEALFNIQFSVRGEKDLKLANHYLDQLTIKGNKVSGVIRNFGRTNTEALNKVQAKYTKLRNGLKKATDNDSLFIRSQKIVAKRLKDTSKASEELHYKFQGQWLSIMFFGMAIRRVFDNITKAGLTSFERVMMGTDEFVRNLNPAYNSLNGLNASFDYLKFSVGQALGSTTSFNGTLARMANWLADLINKHPKAVAAIIRIGGAVAGLVAVLAMSELGVQGLTYEFKVLGGASVISSVKTLTVAVKGLTAALLTNPITWVVMIITVIALLVWWFVKATQKVGSFKEAFKQAMWFMIKFSAIGAAALQTFFTKAFSWLFGLLDKFVRAINKAIQAFNNLTGANISLIDTTLFDKMSKFSHKSWRSLFDTYYNTTMNVLGKDLSFIKPEKTIVSGHWWNPNSWEFANSANTKPQTTIENVNINVTPSADGMYAYGEAIKQKMMDLVTTNGYTQTSG